MNRLPSTWWPRFRNRVLPWFALVAAIVLLGIALSYAWPKSSGVERLSITAGSRTGTRARLAEMLSRTLRDTDLKLVVTGSEGSSDALERTNGGHVELAMVQGGLDAEDFDNVTRIAALHVEPLHLLVRAEIFEDVRDHLLALRGKRINLSTVGSGTNQLATELLYFLHLREGDYEATHLTYEELINPATEDLPDAVFTVSSLPSPVAQFLIGQRGYRLVPLPYAESFQLHWFESRVSSEVNRLRVTPTRIPAYSYEVDPPRPATTIETFGTRLELVANRELSVDVADRLCQGIYESEFTRVFGEEVSPDLLRRESTFPLHPGARQYLQRLQPVSTGRMIEVTEQLVGIVGAALGGMLFLWQWLKRTRERRRDREFVGCVQRVVEIENSALTFDQCPEMTVADLEKLQNELGVIKTKLIDRYRNGELEGADMLSAFLKHANDASELISRIVLHETAPKQPLDMPASE